MAYTPTRGIFRGRRFRSHRAYRNALAQRKGYRSWYAQQRAPRLLRNASAYAALHPSEQEARRRALEALTLMRSEGLSLTHASRRAGTTPAAVLRHGSPALARTRGSYAVTRGDRVLRVMTVLGVAGVEHQVEVRGSRRASLVGEHWSAIDHYLTTGDESRLRRLQGRRVAGIALETDTETIEEWARRGELEIDDVYELTT
jgi:hypothetical protein